LTQKKKTDTPVDFYADNATPFLPLRSDDHQKKRSQTSPPQKERKERYAGTDYRCHHCSGDSGRDRGVATNSASSYTWLVGESSGVAGPEGKAHTGGPPVDQGACQKKLPWQDLKPLLKPIRRLGRLRLFPPARSIWWQGLSVIASSMGVSK